MTNDMIAMTSNWEERLRPQKCDKKDDPQVWGTSSPSDNSNRERKKLNPKTMITYKRPGTTGQMLTNYKYLAISWPVARGAMEAIAPPNSESCTKIFRLILQGLVKPDQSSKVYHMSMINQTLCIV